MFRRRQPVDQIRPPPANEPPLPGRNGPVPEPVARQVVAPPFGPPLLFGQPALGGGDLLRPPGQRPRLFLGGGLMRLRPSLPFPAAGGELGPLLPRGQSPDYVCRCTQARPSQTTPFA